MSYPFQAQFAFPEPIFPSSLNPQHLGEWLESAVDPSLIHRNVQSIAGDDAYENLLYGLPDSERRNDGRLRDKWLFRYSHLDAGGWWVSGLDPHNDWLPMDWGRLKPDQPQYDWNKGKAIKYESPPKVPNRVTYFDVPTPIWDKVGERWMGPGFRRGGYAAGGWTSSLGKAERAAADAGDAGDAGQGAEFGIDYVSAGAESSAGTVQNPETPHQTAEIARWLEIQVIFLIAVLDFCGIDGVKLQNKPHFWKWLQNHPEIPIILTEGEKKAACLLSQGWVAIALPGIWNGRVGKKDFNETLHPDLVPMAQPGRKFIICFDFETNPKTQFALYQATCRTAKVIEAAGCVCQIALLPGPEKGVDDFVAAWGKEAPQMLADLLDDALTLKEYRERWRGRQQRGLSGKYPPNLAVNVRYLSLESSDLGKNFAAAGAESGSGADETKKKTKGKRQKDSQPELKSGNIQLPASGLVGICSDMGTAKTELMRQWRQENPDARFLNNGHRVNLLKNLAGRLQTDIYSDLRSGNLAKAQALSITVDSLYKLQTQANSYDCVFIDEACQYLAHLLHSKTCQEHRADILEVLEYIISTAKLVVLADAHLDDVTVDFFRAMRPAGEQPFIIKNYYQNGGRTIFWYEGQDSSQLISQIFASLMLGKKIMVVSDSKRFIKKLEKMLKADSQCSAISQVNIQPSEASGSPTSSELPNNSTLPHNAPLPHNSPLKVWSIHAENSGSQENIAFIKDITSEVKNVDALLASPSLSTGVDIADYHFDTVFGVFHAVSQTATECAQALHRYRPQVPAHLWVAPRPPFGYQETNPDKIKERMLQSNEMTAFLLRIDKETGKRGVEKDWALDAYCQIEAQRHQSINNLRQDLRQLLQDMGHQIIPMGADRDESTAQHLAEAAQALDAEQIAAIAQANSITQTEYLSRQSKDHVKPEEFYECEKFRISRAYGLPVTEALVERDKGGHLLKQFAALEAILSPSPGTITDPTTGKTYAAPPDLVSERDVSERERLPLCFDWRNYSAQWLARHILGLPKILRRLIDGEEVSATDHDVVRMRDIALQCRAHLKAILGFTSPAKCPPIWLLGVLADQLGLKLVSRKQGPRGQQVSLFRVREEEITFALTVLGYRQQQRQEKAAKAEQALQQREQEQALRQAAYGVSPLDTSVSSPAPERGYLYQGAGTDTEENHRQSATKSPYVSWLSEKIEQRRQRSLDIAWRETWQELQEMVLERAKVLLERFLEEEI
jgi:hypothetical protein